MIHDKTLLFSSNAGNVQTCTLSEPLSAFQRFAVQTQPNVIWESYSTADVGNHRFNTYGYYQTDGYMIWPTNFVISNGTKTLSVNRFQLLMQQGTASTTRTFGFENTANNVKRIGAIWGINRINPVESTGTGSPGPEWKAYNEKLLWSGTDYGNQRVINLSGRAIGYERLKVMVGSHGESPNAYDVDAPQSYSSWLPLNSFWGTSTGSFYICNHRYQWGGETDVLSAISGKCIQLGTGAANPFTTTGNYTATDTFVRRPLMAVWGINEKDKYKVNLLDSVGGSIGTSRTSGYEFDIATLTNTTANENYKFSSYNITGATLTGSQFKFGTSDVQVQGNFEHNKTLTLIDGEHAVLSADKDKGFIGDVVTVTGTMDEGWYLTGFNTTGATMTGNRFAFAGEDVTVEGLYTDEGFPVVYQADNGVHLAGDPIAIPGVGVNLTTSYDTYYRTNGYDITGGYIENGMLYATAACTARLKSKVNAFTATGSWEKGSDVTINGATTTQYSNVGAKYAVHGAHTGEIPAAWYSTSNRWNVNSTVSAYKITLNPKMTFQGYKAIDRYDGFSMTGVCLVGSTQSNSQTYSSPGSKGTYSYYYSKSFTSNSTGVNYGVSARLGAYAKYGSWAKYIAAGTSGTWTATGIAP